MAEEITFCVQCKQYKWFRDTVQTSLINAAAHALTLGLNRATGYDPRSRVNCERCGISILDNESRLIQRGIEAMEADIERGDR